MKRTTFLLAPFVLLFAAGLAQADTITYTESATASGSLGGTPFSDSLITLTFVGDTANIVSSPSFYSIALGSITIGVSSLGTLATLTDPGYVFDAQLGGPSGSGAAGFHDSSVSLDILDITDPAFGSYNLATTIGPITDTELFNAGISFETNSGALIIYSASDSTFSATPESSDPQAPEPATMALFAFGFAGILAVARRK
jgi:hypothetical protein